MERLVYNFDVRVFKRFFQAGILTLLGAIILVPNGYAAASEAAEETVDVGSPNRLRSADQSEELITLLSGELLEAETVIASNSSEIESVESQARRVEAQLIDETNDIAAPAVEGFINSEINTNADRSPNSELRARFIGGQIVAQDDEAIERISDLQRSLSLAETRITLLATASAEVEGVAEATQQAIASEQLSLSRTNQRAIYQRGREGASRPVIVAQAAEQAPVVEETTAAAESSSPSPAGLVSGATYLATCPVAGPHNAIDSYGAPRSSGRTHDGIDILANVGVPIAAPAAGQVELVWGGNIGGNIFRLTADNGVYYYGAHLDSFEGSSRRVNAGEIIGYVGKTGNAQFTPPHLHFEIRPGGRGAAPINPTPESGVVCSGVDASVNWRG